MFGFKRNRSSREAKQIELLTISKNTSLKGEIKTDQPVRIDGKTLFNIETSNRLVIGEEGVLKGHVKCSSLLVLGRLEGNVFAIDDVQLGEQSFVKGNILTKKIHIGDGAKLEGLYKLTTNQPEDGL